MNNKIFRPSPPSSTAEAEARILAHLRAHGPLSVANLARLLQRGTADTALILVGLAGRKLVSHGPLGWGLYGVPQALPVAPPDLDGVIHPYAPQGGAVLRGLEEGGPQHLPQSPAVDALLLSRSILALPDGRLATRAQWAAWRDSAARKPPKIAADRWAQALRSLGATIPGRAVTVAQVERYLVRSTPCGESHANARRELLARAGIGVRSCHALEPSRRVLYWLDVDAARAAGAL